MALTYAPTSHAAPEGSRLDGTPIYGVSPGCVYAALSDPNAAPYVWLPTGTTPDGYPTKMVAFPSGTGAIT